MIGKIQPVLPIHRMLNVDFVLLANIQEAARTLPAVLSRGETMRDTLAFIPVTVSTPQPLMERQKLLRAWLAFTAPVVPMRLERRVALGKFLLDQVIVLVALVDQENTASTGLTHANRVLLANILVEQLIHRVLIVREL